uniref:Tyrosine specific protein phosphatases domain-containing protein n=1 Tax=Panagrolaimus davidi TaxID=227884 RepID=A0A914Q464_9BILA
MKQKVNKNDTISKQPICILNSWIDDNKLPTDDLTKFYSFIRLHALSSKPREGQYLIICPSGAHRSGAWMLYDSEAERLKTKGRIRLMDSAKALRFQRSNTIDTQEIFDQIINALISCAKSL